MARYYSQEEVQEILWTYIKDCGGIGRAAKQLGLSLPYLYQYAAGGRRHAAPSARLAELFGLQKVTAYVGPDNPSIPPLPSPAEKEPCSCPNCQALRLKQPLRLRRQSNPLPSS